MFNSISRRKTTIKVELKKSEVRFTEIDGIIKRLYEDDLCGKIGEERFAVLSKDYEIEQLKLRKRITEINAYLKENDERVGGLNKFLALVDKYTNLEELTAEILNAFIDKIYVGEKVKVSSPTGKRNRKCKSTREIKIIYKFVGAVSLQ